MIKAACKRFELFTGRLILTYPEPLPDLFILIQNLSTSSGFDFVFGAVDEFIEIQADGLQWQLYACDVEPSA